MSVPSQAVQRVLLRETLQLLASYAWSGSVALEPTAVGASDTHRSVPQFLSEFRARHAIAAATKLQVVIQQIEAQPSHLSGLERGESRGVVRGRLDTPRYLARRAGVRSRPRRYPIVQTRWTYGTPENALGALALHEVRSAMRDDPFGAKSAEALAMDASFRWATDRLGHRPWDDVLPSGLVARLYDETDIRVRRRQTGNEDAYKELLAWYDEWALDVGRLGDFERDSVVDGLLAFPAGGGFWDRVFEIWCMLFLVASLEALGWNRIEGPTALHRRSGVIYRYEAPSGRFAAVRFQTSKPLRDGRWAYTDGGPLVGIPDLSLAWEDAASSSPLLIDAKNRLVASTDRIARSEEAYKMLGYAENFRPDFGPARFRGVLIFPARQSGHRTLRGPESGRLDLVAASVIGGRELAHAGIQDAVNEWASTAV